MNSPSISIVSPVYKAEELIDTLVQKVSEEAEKITSEFELILVEDGSPDKCWKKITENCNKDSRIKGVKLSRNFGQHYAVSAGLKEARGDYIIVMDCDLQDDPKDMSRLLEMAYCGYDTVFTRRVGRKHSVLKKTFSWCYKKLFSFISNGNYSTENGSLYLINRKVFNAIDKLNDRPRLLGQVIRWVGFNIGFVEVKHHRRLKGRSSYRLTTLLALAWDGWISHSDKLLRIVIYSGICVSALSFLAVLLIVILKFTSGLALGWASIVVTVLFSTGLILMALGVVGLYVGKIFEQTKERPLFIVDQKLNFHE